MEGKKIETKLSFFESRLALIIFGGIIGLIAVTLVKLGNPGNMGFCIACFERDIAGALGLHRAEIVQYIRPEIIGLVIGAFLCAVFSKEFQSKGGSSPATRFFLGMSVMIGALMFLGCPLRMVLRIGGGDLNAIVGLLGFVCGIVVGIVFLNKGFSLKRNYKTTTFDGIAFPLLVVGLLALLVIAPTFIFFSEKGPGSMRAPMLIALCAGLVVGAIAQKTRLCMVGGIRDAILFKEFTLLLGFVAIIVFALIGNLVFGKFNLGFAEQPIAHSDGLWNFLGMVLVGWGSVLLSGCPLRQLILAGEGNTDSAITALGMIIGAAVCHNFGLASSGAGPTANGQIAVGICLVFLLVVSVVNTVKKAA